MKMLTKIRRFALAAATVLTLVSGQALAAETTVLKLAHVQPQSHVFHKGSVKFADALKKVSGGQMEVEIFSDGVMGNERALLEALQIGSVDVVTVTSALTGTFNPDYRVFSLPFLFDSYEDAFRVMDDESVTGDLGKGLISKGIRPIAYWIGGARSFYGNDPAASIDDFKGRKVRTMKDPVYVETWKAMGALPTPLPFGEVYTALQTKLVDGAEGAINTYVAKKFYEVAPNVAMINYVYSIQPLHISEMKWKKLSAQQQGWVREAAQQAASYERQLVLDEDKALQGTLADHGVKVSHPEIAPFRTAVKPVYEAFRKEHGDRAYSLVEKILNQ
jgi:tripartite ATP-independent transporter DctP family solute receptor